MVQALNRTLNIIFNSLASALYIVLSFLGIDLVAAYPKPPLILDDVDDVLQLADSDLDIQLDISTIEPPDGLIDSEPFHHPALDNYSGISDVLAQKLDAISNTVTIESVEVSGESNELA